MKTYLCALSLGLATSAFLSNAQAGEKLTPPKSASKLASKSAQKAAPAPINLKFCPISGEAVANSGRGGQLIGGYRVQLCCPDCTKTFAKLPAAEKLARVREMAARQAKSKRT